MKKLLIGALVTTLIAGTAGLGWGKMDQATKTQHITPTMKESIDCTVCHSSFAKIGNLDGKIIDYSTQKHVEFDDMMADVIKSDAIYVGESHNVKPIRDFYLDVIKFVHKQHPKMAIGMEMFNTDQNELLQKYLSSDFDSSFPINPLTTSSE